MFHPMQPMRSHATNAAFLATDVPIQVHGVLPQFMSMLSASDSSVPITPTAFTLIIRFMGLVCRGSPSVVLTLLRDGIAATLASVLESEASAENGSAKPVQRPFEQLLAVLTLTNELLPYVPDAAAKLDMLDVQPDASEMPSDMPAETEALSKMLRMEMSGLVSPSSDDASSLAKQQIAVDHSELMFGFAQYIFGPLLVVSTTTVHVLVHQKCIWALAKLVYFLPAECVKELVCSHQISAFLTCFLAANKFASAYFPSLLHICPRPRLATWNW